MAFFVLCYLNEFVFNNFFDQEDEQKDNGSSGINLSSSDEPVSDPEELEMSHWSQETFDTRLTK